MVPATTTLALPGGTVRAAAPGRVFSLNDMRTVVRQELGIAVGVGMAIPDRENAKGLTKWYIKHLCGHATIVES